LAHNLLGVAYAQSGNNNGAVGEFREAVRLDPGFQEAPNNLNLALEGPKKDRPKSVAKTDPR
jgi:Flp pilus assembly protein TadD